MWHIAVDTVAVNRYTMKGVICSVCYDVPRNGAQFRK